MKSEAKCFGVETFKSCDHDVVHLAKQVLFATGSFIYTSKYTTVMFISEDFHAEQHM